MAESSTAVDGGAATLVEPVVVGAVVGGVANLVNTDILFPGWGVLGIPNRRKQPRPASARRGERRVTRPWPSAAPERGTGPGPSPRCAR